MTTFYPVYGSGSIVAPGTVSNKTSISGDGQTALITNLGSVVCYVRSGGSTVAATTADYPVLPSTQITLAKQLEDTHIAYITASGTGSIHIMSGDGA